MTELKPCPFCGLRPHFAYLRELDGKSWYVSCSGRWFGSSMRGCGATSKDYRQKWRALRAWNKRA